MSSIDPRDEFYSGLDDWWAQLWALNIATEPPNKNIKHKFFSFVADRCQEVDDWRMKDGDMEGLFSEFVEDLGTW